MILDVNALLQLIHDRLHASYMEQQATQELILEILHEHVHSDIFSTMQDFFRTKIYNGVKFPRVSAYICSDKEKKKYVIYKSILKKIMYRYALYYYLYAMCEDMLRHETCTNSMLAFVIRTYKCMLHSIKLYDDDCFDIIQKLLSVCEEVRNPYVILGPRNMELMRERNRLLENEKTRHKK